MTGSSRRALALRGLLAVLAIAVVSVLLVLRGGGGLAGNPEVLVAIPASAGLISGEAPVRFAGVKVGRISGIEPGAASSTVRLELNADDLAMIPANVAARVVPRTFFGDIYIQLVADAPSPVGLQGGETLLVDTGPESVALYGVFEKLTDTLAAIEPERMQAALTALSQALGGRGQALGDTIGNLSASSPALAPALSELIATAPEFTSALAGLEEATPDVLGVLAAAATISQTIVENQKGIADTLAAAARYTGDVSPFLDRHRAQITTVFSSAGTILATIGANPSGLTDTLANAQTFGGAGAKVFATGKFNITTVATFERPLPYSAADCPVYAGTVNPDCAPNAAAPNLAGAADLTSAIPVVDSRGEAPAMRVLEDQALGRPASAGGPPNPATVALLGPLVRGNEVAPR